MLLGQAEPEELLDDGGEADALQAREPGAELGVEEPAGPHADVGQARQVLGGGMQHPFGVGEHGTDGAEVRQQRHRRGP